MTTRRMSRLIMATSVAAGTFALLPGRGLAHPDHGEYVAKLEAGVTTRVSVSSDGVEGDAASGRTNCGPVDHYKFQASDDGRFVAFQSRAGNLHPSDVNGQVMQDVFVFDRHRTKIHLASALRTGLSPRAPTSVDLDTFPCGAGSGMPMISGNGRFVAFLSNLPLTATRGQQAGQLHSNVFVRDLKRYRTELVSVTWNGDPPMATPAPQIGHLSISDNGRFVAFSSNITNLTKEDPCSLNDAISNLDPLGNCSQVYVRDRKRKKTILVSRSKDGQPSDAEAQWPVISGNGRYVAFHTAATNLVEDDLGGCSNVPTAICQNVYVHDVRAKRTKLVSVSRDGGDANAASHLQDISDNGRFVVYSSYGTDHVPAHLGPDSCDGNGGTYLRDLKLGRTERISVTSTGTMVPAWEGSISDDGRYAAFTPWWDSGSICYLGQDVHGYRGGKIIDRSTGQADWRTVVRPSPFSPAASAEDQKGPKGTTFDVAGFSTMAIGGNGRFIVGASDSADLVDGDGNEATDVFVRELGNHPLGVGPVRGSSDGNQTRGDDAICVGAACIPPASSAEWMGEWGRDEVGALSSNAELLGASIAHRPELDDLFVTIEVEHMGPSIPMPGGQTSFPLSRGLVYGLRFDVRGRQYEVRASAQHGGSFALFDCTEGSLWCEEVVRLRGGYGTTGERIVFSIPVRAIGVDGGGRLKRVEAYSAVGNETTGATTVLDRLRLK